MRYYTIRVARVRPDISEKLKLLPAQYGMGVIAEVVQYLLICIEGWLSDTGELSFIESRYAGKRLSFSKVTN